MSVCIYIELREMLKANGEGKTEGFTFPDSKPAQWRCELERIRSENLVCLLEYFLRRDAVNVDVAARLHERRILRLAGLREWARLRDIELGVQPTTLIKIPMATLPCVHIRT